jgi:hypothetical protein
MKSRITLTIDPAVSHRARLLARARRQSLSSLVESLLEKEGGGDLSAKAGDSFSKRWGGKMSVKESGGPRLGRLKEKYSL